MTFLTKSISSFLVLFQTPPAMPMSRSCRAGASVGLRARERQATAMSTAAARVLVAAVLATATASAALPEKPNFLILFGGPYGPLRTQLVSPCPPWRSHAG